MPQHEPAVAPALLHMGGPSSVTAKHAGPSLCDLVRIQPLKRASGTRCSVAQWCNALKIPFENPQQGLDALRELAKSPPEDLRSLPAVVPVVLGTGSDARPLRRCNPALALAVLCRCSDKVFIRDKEPILTSALLEKDYSLALPRKDGRQP